MELSAWAVLLAAIFAITTIIVIPRNVIRESRSSKYQDLIKVATDRNLIRATIAQVVAGLAFVATFIQSSHNFSRDFSQRAELATADQFSKAITQIRDTPEAAWSTIGSYQVLANIAKSAPVYHEAVYGSLAQFILQVGKDHCDSKDQYRSQDYQPPPALRSAMRIMVDRNTANDPEWRKFDLARACLVGGDFLSSGGLSKLYMPAAKLVRANIRFSEVNDSDWGELQASVDDNAEWKEMSGWSLVTRGTDRYKWIANFEGAHFKRVIFEGAKLKGANFQGATFASLSFIGADLTMADLRDAEFHRADLRWTKMADANIAKAVFDSSTQLDVDILMTACVRTDDVDSKEQVEKIKPTLPAAVEAEVKRRGGYRLCQ